MKCAVACLLLAFVGLSSATVNLYPRGCIYSNGRCLIECPVGTMSHTVDRGYVTREATCRNPRPRPDKHQTTGYSACHCVHPTVRNEANGQCVHLDKCPQARIIHGHGGGFMKILRRPVDKKYQNYLKHRALPTAPVKPAAPAAPLRPFAPSRPVAPLSPVAPLRPLAPVEPAPAVPVAPAPYKYRYNPNNGYN